MPVNDRRMNEWTNEREGGWKESYSEEELKV